MMYVNTEILRSRYPVTEKAKTEARDAFQPLITKLDAIPSRK